MATLDVVGNILSGAVTLLESMTTTSDTGAPTNFSESDAVVLEKSSKDRGFAVYLTPGGDPDGRRMVTSATGSGTGDYFLRFTVDVLCINEHRSRRAFSEILAKDRRRIIDRMQDYIRTQVADVGECLYEGGGIQFLSPSKLISTLRFRAEYVDGIVST